jgi:RNA polymerase sigma-70 factor (ECF subfamily)
VERYQRPVFALLSRLMRADPAACEDLAQETFLRFFRALPRFDAQGPARLSTWLLTIASRLAIDHLRRTPAPALIESIDAHSDSLRSRGQPAPPGLASALRRAVEALPPDFRAAFLLREAHGLSHQEIAQALEVDVGTARSRLSRARAALRTALEEHHG